MPDSVSTIGSSPRGGRRLLRRLLGRAHGDVSGVLRGLGVRRPEMQVRMEAIEEAFLCGYHSALNEVDLSELKRDLDGIDPERRGFAHEGAAVGLALQTMLMPWRRRRMIAFLDGVGAPHIYAGYVGIGLALALVPLPMSLDVVRRRMDPLLGWLLVDGFGFHRGFFRCSHYVRRQRVPRWLRGHARHVFDQGLGRALWFVDGGEVAAVCQTISAFDESRRGDLWSGVGAACAYAGGASDEELIALTHAAGAYRPQMAQGACFAARVRACAGNPALHTARACAAICGCTAERAAAITDEALATVSVRDRDQGYEQWRRAIASRFVGGGA